MKPDFSPNMLKLYLECRTIIRMLQREETLARAQRAVFKDIAGAAKVTRRAVQLAAIGRLKRASTRAAIWAVLNHFPCDHGVTLTDEGGQLNA